MLRIRDTFKRWFHKDPPHPTPIVENSDLYNLVVVNSLPDPGNEVPIDASQSQDVIPLNPFDTGVPPDPNV